MKIKELPNITLTVQIFREGKMYVANNPELGVATCGYTIDEAKKNIKDAVSGFIKTAKKMGTLNRILEDAGYVHRGKQWKTPELLVMDRFSLAF